MDKRNSNNRMMKKKQNGFSKRRTKNIKWVFNKNPLSNVAGKIYTCISLPNIRGSVLKVLHYENCCRNPTVNDKFLRRHKVCFTKNCNHCHFEQNSKPCFQPIYPLLQSHQNGWLKCMITPKGTDWMTPIHIGLLFCYLSHKLQITILFIPLEIRLWTLIHNTSLIFSVHSKKGVSPVRG